jgi:hypothetical protein
VNTITLSKTWSDHVLAIVSIRKDQPAEEIAKFQGRAVRMKVREEPFGIGASALTAFTGYTFELTYPGRRAIGATVVSLEKDTIEVFPNIEGERSKYGDHLMLPSIASTMNHKQTALRPIIKDEAEIRTHCIPTDFFLVIKHSGVYIRSQVEAGPGWITTTEECLMPFKWSPAQQAGALK